MKQLILSLVIIISGNQLSAQILKGKITNQSGEPVQYSTVYIQELRQGTTANVKGDYEFKLKPGKYTVVYQSLGYEPVYVTLTLSDKTIIRNVTLPVQYYQIPEVRISATGEDPAYIIMRKVIGMAPYYLNNISYYKAEVYLKGNVVFKKIPKLLQKSMKMSSDGNSTSVGAGGKPEPQERIIREGDAFMMESLNEIEFTAPDRYNQKMISYNSTFPEEGNELSPMGYIEASFYQPVLAEMAISPLSPQAFSHYRFRYQGATLQGNYTINKIEVIPKRKSQQLFEGVIYIIEDLWCLHSVDLKNNNRIGEIKIQQLYIPVQDDIWMPVSHKFEVNASIFGLKADAGYSGSIKYTDVRPNLALEKPKTISTDSGGRTIASQKSVDSVPPSKTRQQIEKLMEKDDLSNRDMVKLSRLMEKESKNSVNDSLKNSLEITDNTEKTVEKDAAKKDSSYWAQIRPVPLTDTDIKSLRVRDSIRSENEIRKPKDDTTSTSSAAPKKSFPRTMRYITRGHTWGSTWRDTTHRYSITWGGLIDLEKFRFNTVDGFVYGVDFGFQRYFKGGSSFSIYPEVSWAFSRKSLMWRANAMYYFNSLNQQQLYIRTGS
ncbi:MAG: carboxypeptidase-like regulatory domain-containing protein, partial [Bacteroidia bacterium]|nr:carboxypeptidase-like regulatory domain-containing protein [Bacteroidia bacterium]